MRAGSGITHREQEWVCVGPQLLEQALLQFGGGARGAHGRVHLDTGEVQVPAEGQADDVNVFLAIAEGAGQGDEHWEGDAESVGQGPLSFVRLV